MSLIGSVLQIMAQQEAGRLARIQGERAKAMATSSRPSRPSGAPASRSPSASASRSRSAAGDLVASRALAVAAASGAGVSDPTMVRVIANARGEGAVRAATALYEGQARSRRCAPRRRWGASPVTRRPRRAGAPAGLRLASAGTGSRVASLYSKYGMNGAEGRRRARRGIGAGTPAAASRDGA
jgi:hypothetical protein